MKRRTADPFDLARSALERGQLDRAEAECARVLSRSPGHAGALTLSVAIAVARERWEDALARVEAAPRDAFVELAQARALLGLGRLDEAHAALRRSRDLDPSDPGLYELEATILRASGDLEGALHAAEGALALDAHRGSAYTLRAELLELLGRADEALESLRIAVRSLGRDPPAGRVRARPHDGPQYARRADGDPAHHVAVLDHLAKLLDARGETEEAAVARSLAAQVGAR